VLQRLQGADYGISGEFKNDGKSVQKRWIFKKIGGFFYTIFINIPPLLNRSKL
jgi:hypothetical protein